MASNIWTGDSGVQHYLGISGLGEKPGWLAAGDAK
jgi:hypothetical protein